MSSNISQIIVRKVIIFFKKNECHTEPRNSNIPVHVFLFEAYNKFDSHHEIIIHSHFYSLIFSLY